MATKLKLLARQGASRLVATMVATLPPGDHTDPSVPGLQLRVRAKRGGTSRTWLLRYRWREEFVRIVLGHFRPGPGGMSLGEARTRALELRKAIDDGIDPRHARPKRRPTLSPLPGSAAVSSPDAKYSIEYLVSEFTERYLRPHRKRPEYAEAILAKSVLPEWRGRDARTIVPAEVLDVLDKIAARAPVMANRTAAILGQLFKFGIHRRIVTTTPVQLLMRPGGKEKPRARAWSDTELTAYLKDPRACTRYARLAHVITLLLTTGVRRGELAAAKWVDVDLKTGLWRIPAENSKTGRARSVPLVDMALEQLRELQVLTEGSRYVLPGKDGKGALEPKQLTRGVAKCLERFKEQGIAAFTLHDLRRTVRSGLSRLRVDAMTAERVLGHSVGKMIDTYDVDEHLEAQRAALEKWAAHLTALTGEPVQECEVDSLVGNLEKGGRGKASKAKTSAKHGASGRRGAAPDGGVLNNVSAKVIITVSEMREFIAHHRWVFAKTMPQHPHEYTLRKHARSDEEFEAVVSFIRAEGYTERHSGRTYTYLNVDDWKYWTMGAPLPVTIIINRARI
jgi:integrase